MYSKTVLRLYIKGASEKTHKRPLPVQIRCNAACTPCLCWAIELLFKKGMRINTEDHKKESTNPQRDARWSCKTCRLGAKIDTLNRKDTSRFTFLVENKTQADSIRYKSGLRPKDGDAKVLLMSMR
jgi:hypothetical protein